MNCKIINATNLLFYIFIFIIHQQCAMQHNNALIVEDKNSNLDKGLVLYYGEKLRKAVCKKNLNEARTILLQHKNPKIVDYQRDAHKTPLIEVACKRDNKEVNVKMIQLLLDNGASVNLGDDYGQRALHYAAGCGNPKHLIMLVNKGASIDIEDKDKRTPLHWAFANNQRETVLQLLKLGAKIKAEDICLIGNVHILTTLQLVNLSTSKINFIIEDHKNTAVSLISHYYLQKIKENISKEELREVKMQCYLRLRALGKIEEKYPKATGWHYSEKDIQALDSKYLHLLESGQSHTNTTSDIFTSEHWGKGVVICQ